MGVQESDPLTQLSLPPGFRFYPTDEELLVQYLCRKVAGHHFSLPIIGEVDLYKFDPWVLPSKALFGEKEWYFFSPRERKYPNGSRPNRVAGSGYWKATGTDKIIMTEGRRVGIKKALVFYVGKAPKGSKTNWIMHEYRLSESPRKSGSSRLDDWVLCRIYKKSSSGQKPMTGIPTNEFSHGSSSSSSSQLEDMLESFPEMKDRSFALPQINSLKTLQNDDKINIQRLNSGNFDWASLAGVASLPELAPAGQNLNSNMRYNDMCALPAQSMEKLYVDEEVQSGLRNNSNMNSGLFQQNSNGFAQGFGNVFDPYGIPHPTQQGGFGFRQ